MITVSASATPVSVEVTPRKMIHFGSCSAGGCVTKSVEVRVCVANVSSSYICLLTV